MTTKPKEHFGVVTWNGTGAGANHAITGLGFKPDLVWVKGRDITSDHYIYDSVRGTTKALKSNSTSAELTAANSLVSFDANGFTVGDDWSNNSLSHTFVAWCWKAGGAAVANTDGNIQSQVSVNKEAGFSIVSYTGSGGNKSVGHGLGVKPDFILVKVLNQTNDWHVYHTALGFDKSLYLNASRDQITNTPAWGGASPDASVFHIGPNTVVNGGGDKYIAYCWVEVPGYSKFGKYIGNNSADGAFVYLGFTPAYILIKRIDGNEEWHMHDAIRDPYNPATHDTRPNSNTAERNEANNQIDFLANGFKLRSDASGQNSGGQYIYMAFAEHPLKYANAR